MWQDTLLHCGQHKPKCEAARKVPTRHKVGLQRPPTKDQLPRNLKQLHKYPSHPPPARHIAKKKKHHIFLSPTSESMRYTSFCSHPQTTPDTGRAHRISAQEPSSSNAAYPANTAWVQSALDSEFVDHFYYYTGSVDKFITTLVPSSNTDVPPISGIRKAYHGLKLAKFKNEKQMYAPLVCDISSVIDSILISHPSRQNG